MNDEGPLSAVAGGWARQHQHWLSLNEIERNLVRVGNGFALVVLLLGNALVFYGARATGAMVFDAIADPIGAWQGSLFIALIAFGTVRFFLGVPRVAGLRDAPRAWGAFVRLALGVAAALYLRGLVREAATGASEWLFVGLLLVLELALWHALAGAARLIVLLWPRRSAYETIVCEIEAQQFSWDDSAPDRPERRR